MPMRTSFSSLTPVGIYLHYANPGQQPAVWTYSPKQQDFHPISHGPAQPSGNRGWPAFAGLVAEGGHEKCRLEWNAAKACVLGAVSYCNSPLSATVRVITIPLICLPA